MANILLNFLKSDTYDMSRCLLQIVTTKHFKPNFYHKLNYREPRLPTIFA